MGLAFRIGHGFDVHAFTAGDAGVRLCGVSVPYEQQLLGHSDADVGLHALCDALFGALAERDIGYHFPDNDAVNKDRDSCEFVRYAYELCVNKGYNIGNIDITLVAQAPKLLNYIPQMIARVAQILQITIQQVNIKATTTEQLGFVGRKEGIAAHAVVLLQSNNI